VLAPLHRGNDESNKKYASIYINFLSVLFSIRFDLAIVVSEIKTLRGQYEPAPTIQTFLFIVSRLCMQFFSVDKLGTSF
jgi:hypothetical protein